MRKSHTASSIDSRDCEDGHSRTERWVQQDDQQMTSAIMTDASEGLATRSLNRPWKPNAWNTPMRAEVADASRRWNEDAAVRAVMLTGAGERKFSAGQDLDETEKFQSGGQGAAWFQTWRDFCNAIRDLDKPTLAALNGLAAGSAYQAEAFASGEPQAAMRAFFAERAKRRAARAAPGKS